MTAEEEMANQYQVLEELGSEILKDRSCVLLEALTVY